MTIKITKALVRAALDRAVARKGVNYVYTADIKPDDQYVYVNDDGTPGCIVGHVLLDLGVPASAFLHGSVPGLFGTAERINVTRFGMMKDALPIEFADNRVLYALTRAQELQDDGAAWGEARDAAVHVLDKA
jgi:hypothetical protein